MSPTRGREMYMSEEQVVEGGVVQEAVVQEGIPQTGEIPRDQVETKAEESTGKQEEKPICRAREYKELFDAVFRMAAAIDKDTVTIGVDKRGMLMREFSPDKTQFIVIEVPFSAFSEWEVGEGRVLDLSLGDILKTLRAIQKGTPVTMEIHKGRVVIETPMQRYEIPVVFENTDYADAKQFMEEYREPNVPFTVKFTVKAEEMRKALRPIAQGYGHDTIVKVKNGRVFLMIDTDWMKSEVRLPAFVVDEKGEAETIYDGYYLYKFFNAVKVPSVTVEMATDKPMRVSGRDGYSFRWYLAHITRR